MDYSAQYHEYLLANEQALYACFERAFTSGSTVSAAAGYSLFAGGKRTRGVLVLSVCDALSGSSKQAAAYSAAIEMLHCYSLIHDDLPCMDNDDFRRGKPSCHKAHGEATALLAGDALLTAAFETLISTDCTAVQNSQAVSILAKAAGPGGMVFGQELDLAAENAGADGAKKIDEKHLQLIHKNKTGKLICAACALGAVAGNGTTAQCSAIEAYAKRIGLVFQIVDDVLDITSTTQELGKPVGSDAANGKVTFATLLGVNEAMKRAQALTDEACDILRGTLASKADFLCELAQMLSERKK